MPLSLSALANARKHQLAPKEEIMLKKNPENVTLRISPKLRYLCELAARKQQRSLSNFIEWAARHALTDSAMDPEPTPGLLPIFGVPLPLWNEVLWSEEESERLFKLANLEPSLMNPTESLIWKAYAKALVTSGRESSLETFHDFYEVTKAQFAEAKRGL